MKKINTGDLNQRIQIVKFNNESDGAGGVYPVESVYWETSAMVKPIRSANVLEANQQSLKDGFEFIVRYRSDKFIKPDMRIKWRGSYLSLVSVPVDYVYKEWLQFKAVWMDRPEAPDLSALSIYFGTSDTGEPLTIEEVLAGQQVVYDPEAGILIPFNNPLYKYNWFWVQDGIPVPTQYQNVDNEQESGVIGSDQDLFAAFQVVGSGSLAMGNYEVPLESSFLMS